MSNPLTAGEIRAILEAQGIAPNKQDRIIADMLLKQNAPSGSAADFAARASADPALHQREVDSAMASVADSPSSCACAVPDAVRCARCSR